jgi:hypothetical protein
MIGIDKLNSLHNDDDQQQVEKVRSSPNGLTARKRLTRRRRHPFSVGFEPSEASGLVEIGPLLQWCQLRGPCKIDVKNV